MDGKKIVRPYGKALTAVVAVLFFLAFSVWVVSAVECGCGGICVNETGWWRADADYNASGTPIQAAIDNATAGDIICVKDGKYNGNVLVNKEHLTIRSENGSENCSVNATTMPELHVFHVSSDFVNISGFTLQNTTSFAGIYLYYVNHCNISGNNASNNGDGISLFHADSNTVMNNTVSNNSDDGIYLAYSSNNKVMNNTVSYSSDDGIYLKEASNNNLTNNLAFNNTGDGVYLKQTSNNNSLTNNTLTNNTDYDFYSDATSHNNTVEDLRLSSYPTIVSFTYDNGVGLKGVETAPGDPAGKTNINKYVNATNVSIDSWLYLNVSYEDVGCVAEDSLRLWRHNGSAWANVTGTNGVNTVQNYVYATITEFSVFAPMGDGPTLTLGNVTNVTQDWGRNFTLNHSVTAANASAANVNVTYNVTWIPGNTTMGSLTKDETKWHNQSVSNGTVQNVTVRGNATTTSASAANGTGTFWINITKRDINVIAHPPTPQTVDPDETFWINGSAADDYGDALFAKADLIREGSIENTTAIVNGNANFSANESAAGTFNFSIRFYNMTHYTNASSDNATVTVGGPTLTLGNVTNVTQDWGRNFTLNHSVTAANASAANVNVTYNVTWIPGNTTMGSLTKDETKWHNQSRSNGTVQNVTVRVNATTTSASAANATTTFRINITKRDINVIAHPATPQTVDPDETFWINGSAADDYGDALFAKADLIREGSIENTTDIANGNANFSANESAAGTFNFSILFYNLTHYNNASSANATVTVGGPTLTLGNVTNVTQDWGRGFALNHTVTAANATAANVNVTYNVTWITGNDTMSTLTKGETKWHNQSISNGTVQNVTVRVNATTTSASATNDTATLWINITKRDIIITAHPATPQNVDPDENFWINGSAVDEHGDALFANADLIREGEIKNTTAIVSGNANFSVNESAAGTFNFSIRFYNMTYYTNASSANATVTVGGAAPNITDFAPTSPVNDTYCTDRTFNVSVNQTVNVTWYLNDTAQVPKNVSVTAANYTFHALYIGDNNVTAVAENANGSDRQEWVWNVTAAPAAGAPNITDFAPTSPVNDTYCTDRTFNVSVNQTVNVTWYLNDTAQVPKNVSVTAANYTFHALYVGDNNVTAVAENANGTDRQEWVWNVTAAPAAGAPNITDFAPLSPVNDTYCTDRTFNVSVNQTVNVTWYLNDTAQVPKNVSVTAANYTFHALYIGDNNVTAVTENANGTDRQEWVWNVTAAPAAGAPNITDFAPTSPVNDTYCTDRTFNVSVNQTVNVTWYLNDTAQVPKNASVTDANYTFHALYIGDNNVTVVVENPNGKDRQEWIWNVTAAPAAGAPNITDFAPTSPVNDTYCTDRTFNVSVNQTVNVTWYLNDTAQVPKNVSVTAANYTFHALYVGDNNVTVVVENPNGKDMQTWDWNVTEAPEPPIAVPDFSATGLFMGIGMLGIVLAVSVFRRRR